VIDTGIGIPKENHDKLFKLFGFVQDDRQINKNGIGLGLMIARNIVEKFDGKITFKSEKGVGSTFSFSFKLEGEI
jgi:signal transduction histidine kinase